MDAKKIVKYRNAYDHRVKGITKRQKIRKSILMICNVMKRMARRRREEDIE